MNVLLPAPWEQWVQSQVRSGEYGSAGEVIREALRLFRDRHEERGEAEMRRAFGELDRHSAKGEPTAEDLAMIDRAVRRVRKGNGRRK